MENSSLCMPIVKLNKQANKSTNNDFDRPSSNSSVFGAIFRGQIYICSIQMFFMHLWGWVENLFSFLDRAIWDPSDILSSDVNINLSVFWEIEISIREIEPEEQTEVIKPK